MSAVPEEATADHLSIGEVLSLLREEFPDVTISKIRFLESQGLIDPERTPSGYRKFYTVDIERLRWVLLQQRDNYLPLKVIKGRLEEHGPSAPDASTDDGPTSGGRSPGVGAATPGSGRRPPDELPFADIDVPSTAAEDLGRSGTGASMTRGDLAAAAGLDEAEVEELESFGLIRPVVADDDAPVYDEQSLVIVRAAAAFAEHGVEPRHLRMYRHFADREAALFEQVLLPYLRQRNPEARARAQEGMAELAALGRDLRLALLREAAVRTLPEA
ncbi:MAG: MerR family transcriptional regulator [Acidimicrobiia bacterium]